MSRSLIALLVFFSAVAAPVQIDVPLFTGAAGGSAPRVATTDTGAAYSWVLNGTLYAAVDRRHPAHSIRGADCDMRLRRSTGRSR